MRCFLYDEFQMRRAFSILLVLVFGFGPLSAVLGASGDSRLPACCRRLGAHRCAMSADAMAPANSAPAFNAPSRCPLFPDSSAAPLPPVYGTTAAAAGLPSLLAHPHSPATSRALAQVSQIRTRSGRAPPANKSA
jgi:hypothetical protein